MPTWVQPVQIGWTIKKPLHILVISQAQPPLDFSGPIKFSKKKKNTWPWAPWCIMQSPTGRLSNQVFLGNKYFCPISCILYEAHSVQYVTYSKIIKLTHFWIVLYTVYMLSKMADLCIIIQIKCYKFLLFHYMLLNEQTAPHNFEGNHFLRPSPLVGLRAESLTHWEH